jgi:hypothetical protein
MHFGVWGRIVCKCRNPRLINGGLYEESSWRKPESWKISKVR